MPKTNRIESTIVKATGIRSGKRKNYDTFVDVKVGHIMIKNISIVDDHQGQAIASLPTNIEITDEALKEKVLTTALAEHYGVSDAMTKRAPRRRNE
jgi:hypothetical protein